MTYLLMLNDMRFSHAETLTPVARAESREELEAFLREERVPFYRDGKWGKEFAAGGPLEWFNPPLSTFKAGVLDVGTIEHAIERLKGRWAREILCVPPVPIRGEARPHDHLRLLAVGESEEKS